MMRDGKDYCIAIVSDYENKHLGRYQRRRAFKALRAKPTDDKALLTHNWNDNGFGGGPAGCRCGTMFFDVFGEIRPETKHPCAGRKSVNQDKPKLTLR